MTDPGWHVSLALPRKEHAEVFAEELRQQGHIAEVRQTESGYVIAWRRQEDET